MSSVLTLTPSLVAFRIEGSSLTIMPFKPSSTTPSLPRFFLRSPPVPSPTLPSSALLPLSLEYSSMESSVLSSYLPFPTQRMQNKAFFLPFRTYPCFSESFDNQSPTLQAHGSASPATLSQALHYNHLLTGYSPVISADFENKRSSLWSAKA